MTQTTYALYSTTNQCPTPCPEPMYSINDVSTAGKTPKKAGPQRIPTGRPPTFLIQPLHQYIIPLLIPPPIPGIETHGRPGWPRRKPPRKTCRNRNHAGDPHQQEPTLPQSAILFYLWIWCWFAPENHAQSPILLIICPTSHVTRYICMPTR